jgi:hypothetical protein
MLCRVGLGRLLGGFFATMATSPELAPLRCFGGGFSYCFVVFVVVRFPALWFVTGAGVSPQLRCTRRSFDFFFLMQ